MWRNKQFLIRCQALKEAGFEPEFEPGAHLCRGFADLGFEEYCLLSGDRLLSIFTGTITELHEAEKSHLFEIPSISRAANWLHKTGWDVSSIITQDQRSWCLSMKHHSTQEEIVVEERSIDGVFLEAILLALKNVDNEASQINS